MILAINTSSQAMNYMAAGLAEAGLLHKYIRPYAYLGRGWELRLSTTPALKEVYKKTFGRRNMPAPLTPADIKETALGWDLAMACHARLPFRSSLQRSLGRYLVHAQNDSLAVAGARLLHDKRIRMVLASWGCAEHAFSLAKKRGVMCVLNYPLAHHVFTRRFLMEEAEREPDFAPTLNSHDRPDWQIEQLNREIELADRILVGSTFVRDTFVDEGVPMEKIEVIPYGADTSIFYPCNPARVSDGCFRMVFAGQLGQRKGLSYLLRACERVHDDKTSLTLVGRTLDGGSALRPWQHVFQHVPHVPRRQLAEIFRQSDVFVFPSLVEGMGIAVIEAMASGLPVIVTPNGPCDIVRDGQDGFIVPPRDVDAIAHCLQLLKSDPGLRAEMAVNARARSEEFTWDRYRQKAVSRFLRWLKERAPSSMLSQPKDMGAS